MVGHVVRNRLAAEAEQEALAHKRAASHARKPPPDKPVSHTKSAEKGKDK